jgi:ketose-bisphosphate aldolase
MTAKELLLKAQKEHYAIGAFNACNIETLKPILNAASRHNAPVIIEASDGEVKYIGAKEIAALARIYRAKYGIPIILNLDHGASFEMCKEAVDCGFDYVHFDGSKLPFEENVAIAKEVVGYAHEHNVLVEGEIDHIEGSSADHTKEDPKLFQQSSHYTNPEQAKEFVEKTGVDTFASFVGNLHGLYAEEIHLNLEILKQIRKAIPNTFLSLHGGSGINSEEVKMAVDGGIVKVNVNSEMRVTFKNTLQKTLNESSEVAFYKLSSDAIKAVEEIVERKILLFGSSNRA